MAVQAPWKFFDAAPGTLSCHPFTGARDVSASGGTRLRSRMTKMPCADSFVENVLCRHAERAALLAQLRDPLQNALALLVQFEVEQELRPAALHLQRIIRACQHRAQVNVALQRCFSTTNAIGRLFPLQWHACECAPRV